MSLWVTSLVWNVEQSQVVQVPNGQCFGQIPLLRETLPLPVKAYNSQRVPGTRLTAALTDPMVRYCSEVYVEIPWTISIGENATLVTFHELPTRNGHVALANITMMPARARKCLQELQRSGGRLWRS
jgi:hypothetical protein